MQIEIDVCMAKDGRGKVVCVSGEVRASVEAGVGWDYSAVEALRRSLQDVLDDQLPSCILRKGATE